MTTTDSRGLRSAGRRAWLLGLLLAAVLVCVAVVPLPALAHISDSCGDRFAGGTLECHYGPQVVGPWRISTSPVALPGPFYSVDSALEAHEKALRLTYSTACSIRKAYVGLWGDFIPMLLRSDPALAPFGYEITPAGPNGCGTPWIRENFMQRAHDVDCKPGWQGNWNEPEPRICFRLRTPNWIISAPSEPARRDRGILLPTGAKTLKEADYRGQPGGVQFVRHYRTDGVATAPGELVEPWKGLGQSWQHNYAGRLTPAAPSVWVQWGTGGPRHYAYNTQPEFPRRLSPMARGEQAVLVELSAGRYAYTTDDNRLVIYEGGLPQSVHLPSGRGVTLSYLAGALNAAQDSAGRRLQFDYDALGHIVKLTDPAQQDIVYGYKEAPTDPLGPVGMPDYTTLASVRFQDLSTRSYVVPDWTPGGEAMATLITDIVDELGATFETTRYSEKGLVEYTELAGGVGRHTLVPPDIVEDPLGTRRSNRFSTSAPFDLVQASQPAGSGSAAASFTNEYDGNTGTRTSSTSYTGSKTCYRHDTARNVELARIEGLASFVNCATVTPDNAALPAGTRKISTQWHPDWRLPIKVAEPGRITTTVYNGQPDPFKSGALASCAPAAALLPDGRRIAVVCKQVVQATTDGDGRLGFSASLQGGVADRQSKWTYNERGQVLSEDGPRTDVSDVTTYEYYTDTTTDHTLGDLKQITNAANQITRYLKYDRHGQVLQSQDPNGAVTTYSYDLRQRTKSVTTEGGTTTYDYDAAGQLKRLTLPDATWIGYDYDAAHRQTAVYDHSGNRIDYVLDNAGNRVGENAKDPGGALQRQLGRSIDALGRVQQSSGRE